MKTNINKNVILKLDNNKNLKKDALMRKWNKIWNKDL